MQPDSPLPLSFGGNMGPARSQQSVCRHKERETKNLWEAVVCDGCGRTEQSSQKNPKAVRLASCENTRPSWSPGIPAKKCSDDGVLSCMCCRRPVVFLTPVVEPAFAAGCGQPPSDSCHCSPVPASCQGGFCAGAGSPQRFPAERAGARPRPSALSGPPWPAESPSPGSAGSRRRRRFRRPR